jgi:group I intron endonuclease
MYVGKACYGAAVRWAHHLAGYYKNSLMAKAIKKHGAENFTFEVIYDGVDNAEICRVEKGAISSHNSFVPNGYNMTVGGEGVTGMKMSAETKALKSKIASAWQTGRTLSDSHKAACRRGSSGRVYSAESRKKKSESLKRYYQLNPIPPKLGTSRPKLNRSVMSVTKGVIYDTWKQADAARGLTVGLTHKQMKWHGESRGEVFIPLQEIAYERFL